MAIENIISKINKEIISAFAVTDGWFDSDPVFLYEKSEEGRSPANILRHMVSVNHYLLLQIEEAGNRAKVLVHEENLQEALESYMLEYPALEEYFTRVVPERFALGDPGFLKRKSLPEIREVLRDQLYRLLCLLDALSKGEGVLCRISMPGSNIIKADIYQRIYFIACFMKKNIETVAGIFQF